jgi:hypothetical protein
MTRIVRTTYRYKRPPRPKKPVALEVPAMVKAADPPRASKQGRGLPPGAAPPSAAAEKQPAIVSIRRRGRFRYAEDLTPEELRRRADAADALFRDIVRQIAETT